MPKKSNEERDFRDQRKKLYKKINREASQKEYGEGYKEFRSNFAENINSENKNFQKKQRDLSNCVVSRWYRAPEIILT